MLVLAPAACCLAGVAVHEVLKILMQSIRQEVDDSSPSTTEPKKVSPPPKKGKPAAKVSQLPEAHLSVQRVPAVEDPLYRKFICSLYTA